MVNVFQIGSVEGSVFGVLIMALIIVMTAALNMIRKKRMNVFVPFFVFGLGLCLTGGFMFYGLFGVAVDVFYIVTFVSAVGIFFEIWGAGR